MEVEEGLRLLLSWFTKDDVLLPQPPDMADLNWH